MGNGRFRNSQWDIALLIAQILSTQLLVYFFFGILIVLNNKLFGFSFNISSIFVVNIFQISDHDRTVLIIAFIISSALSPVLLWKIVKRGKQCLDFSSTFCGIHLLISWWLNSSFPSNFVWWFLNTVRFALMCLGGEILCLKSELKEIPIGYSITNELSIV